jgi:hypothetical protein
MKHFRIPPQGNEALDVKQQAVGGAGVLILNISDIMDIIYCFLSGPHEAFRGVREFHPIDINHMDKV